MDITLHQLQCFDAVVREGSFQAGAAHLHRTHSTVFTAVKNLEAQLGLSLLDRSGYRVTLTEVGRKKLVKLTEDHQGKPLAIIVAGKVISAPIVRETIDEDKIVVSGSFTKEDVERIAEGIKKK